MVAFQLHPQLVADTYPVCNLLLSTVLLMSDQRYPWFIMVPRRPNLVEITDLVPEDQQTLYQEINHAAQTVKTVFSADKLNIAALGNVVPQLHIHVIARFRSDPAWPQPVWSVGKPEPYTKKDAETVISLFKNVFECEQFLK
jgi:diadenosine tetraphosphate (Ap4A) HIT family hydrolase